MSTYPGWPAASAATTHIDVLSVADRLAQVNRLLSIKEVADLLGESTDTISRRVKRGTMPHLRIGSHTRFDPHELAQWLRAHSVC
jgi:excisionase family DNA binding protein